MAVERPDIKSLQEVSRMLLYLPIDTNAFIFSHPFFNSVAAAIKKDGDLKLCDMQDEKQYKEVLDHYSNLIDSTTSPLYLFMQIRTPYRLTWLKFSKDYLPDKLFYELFADAWTSAEFANQDKNVTQREVLKWFTSAPKEYIMDKEELKVSH